MTTRSGWPLALACALIGAWPAVGLAAQRPHPKRWMTGSSFDNCTLTALARSADGQPVEGSLRAFAHREWRADRQGSSRRTGAVHSNPEIPLHRSTSAATADRRNSRRRMRPMISTRTHSHHCCTTWAAKEGGLAGSCAAAIIFPRRSAASTRSWKAPCSMPARA